MNIWLGLETDKPLRVLQIVSKNQYILIFTALNSKQVKSASNSHFSEVCKIITLRKNDRMDTVS